MNGKLTEIENQTGCRKLSHSDPVFAAWLATYVAARPISWLGKGKGKKHEYWAVPLDKMKQGVHGTLAGGLDRCYLGACLNDDEAVLAIAPACVPHPLKAKIQTLLRDVALIAMRWSDVIFKWGEKTCPGCFSRKLSLFKVAEENEPPHFYCNGCNTIWPPRTVA
jgi:hypothetical protein